MLKCHFGLLLLLYFLPSWAWIGAIPPAFFDPNILSLSNLSNGYLPGFIYKIADITGIVLGVMITLGIRTRIALIFMFTLCTFFYSYTYSLGKIDHDTSFLIFTFLILAFTNSGSHKALLKDKKVSIKTQSLAISILAIMICFGFFTSGISKFINWIDFDLSTSGFLFWFNNGYFLENSNMFLAPYVFDIPILVLEFMDYFAAIFEISAFIFLLNQ